MDRSAVIVRFSIDLSPEQNSCAERFKRRTGRKCPLQTG